MDALRFYVIDIFSAPTTFDIGTVAPASSDDTRLRLENTNDTYQAEDVVVSVAGADAIQLWLSLDGDIFTPTIALGDIAAGASSDTFYLRRVTPGGTADGSCSAELTATPAGWTGAADPSTSDNVPITTED